MTEAIDHREYNKFSNKSKNLIKKVQQLTVNATQLIPQLYDSLKEDGIPPLEARTYIEEIVVISQRQLRRILPDEAKYIEKQNKPELILKEDADIRPHIKQSEIPPPPQVVREAEIEIDPEGPIVPHRIDEPNREIILDCNKFRSELRIATLNGSKVTLRTNKANEVIEIKT